MTSSSNRTLERIARRIPIPEPAYERLLRRRDRKHRSQRILAGSVGIMVFVLAVSALTTLGSLDRIQTPIVPGGDTTDPSETGPAVTGPALTGPVIGPTGNPYSVGFEGLPPEGATPSEPLRGELVFSSAGIHPYYTVNVYADGRLIWARDAIFTGEFVPTPPPEGGPNVSDWIEQRLTPEGVELLRSRAVPLGGQFTNPGEQLPVSAWEDPALRPYVPSRYGACLYGGFEPPSQTMDPLPAWAQDLLSDTDGPVKAGCRVVTLQEAQAIAEVLIDAGFEVSGDTGWVGGVTVSNGSGVGSDHDTGSAIEFVPLLPDGRIAMTGG